MVKGAFFVDETYHRPSICLAVEVACYSSEKYGDALDAVELLKRELRGSSLQSIDKSLPFVSECDTTDVAISATLNQDGRPVPFMSRTLQGSEKHYPTFEKEATVVVEAVKKW